VTFVITNVLARARKRRGAVIVAGAAVLAGLACSPALAGSVRGGGVRGDGDRTAAGRTAAAGRIAGQLPSPPRPPSGAPAMPHGYHAPTALSRPTHRAHGPRTAARSAVTPSQARTWGESGQSTTLVLYDSTGTWGWLGELYAIGAGNLATHFGTVTAEPVADYVQGQINDYTTTIYLGSTYNEPLPPAFLQDALTTTHPIIWAGDNIWQLSGAEGSSTDTSFEAAYGWDPSSSYIDATDSIGSVSYKGVSFTRSPDNTGGVLAPHITSPASVNVLATANCASTCAPVAQTSGSSFPWAINSGNLMYIGEIPFSYMSMTDRYIAFSDLLFRDLAPDATPSHLALVRLEDVSPASDPAALVAMASYLKSVNIPFSVAVIPQYTDPKGVDNNGVPRSESLLGEPALTTALRTAVADGGTLVQHGYTHQYSDVDNPFTGVSGDDFEFYRAQCAPTLTSPYAYDDPCPNSDYVIETGPLPGDSQLSAFSRVTLGRLQFALAGLPAPTIWTTPHYAASAADYAGIDQVYSVRYEQELFFGGQLSGGPIDYSHAFGQFFPYEVHDLYGSTIIPENLGDYEPVEQNNNPPRLVSDMLNEGSVNLAVTQGVASFFVHPDDDPLTVLRDLVQGLQAEGYTFTSPAGLMSVNG
jgi:uncharacterized protein YdaL